MKPDFILYHGACFDGFTGAYACYLKYKNDKTIKYLPMYHNQEYTEEFINQFNQKNVIMIDFSTPLNITQKILDIADNVLIIDHHITAQKDLDLIDDKNKIFDITKSGAVLAYQYFFPKEEIPIEFLYIQDRDLWTWKMEKESKPFTNALFVKIDIKNITNHYQKFEEYHQIFNKTSYLIEYGNTLLEIQKSLIQNQIHSIQKVKFKNVLFNHFNGVIIFIKKVEF